MEGIMSAAIEFFSPNTLPPAQGYSQVVKVKGGEMIFLSGQVGLTLAGELAGTDYSSQLEQAFRNIDGVDIAVADRDVNGQQVGDRSTARNKEVHLDQ